MKKLAFLLLILTLTAVFVGCVANNPKATPSETTQSPGVSDQPKATPPETTQSPGLSDQPEATPAETTQSHGVSEYLTEENGEQYLILPISKAKLRVKSQHLSHLNKIDADLLKKAEEMISGYISSYSQNSGIYLGVCDGKLCLCAEAIVKIDPPNTSEYGSSGCGIDHDHRFFYEQITK